MGISRKRGTEKERARSAEKRIRRVKEKGRGRNLKKEERRRNLKKEERGRIG